MQWATEMCLELPNYAPYSVTSYIKEYKKLLKKVHFDKINTQGMFYVRHVASKATASTVSMFR